MRVSWRRFLCRAALLVLVGVAPAAGQEPAPPRVGVKVLPGTGVVVPHQQLSDYDPGIPLGIGLETLWTPRFALSVDLTKAWHSGGSGAGSDLRLSSAQILGRWRFPEGLRWGGWGITPFLQAGIGFYQAEVDNGTGRRDYGGPGLSLGGGVEWPVWKAWQLQPELRSNWVKGDASSGRGDLRMGHTQILLWAVYRLP